MNDIFKEKYLKYSPEITFDIFKLVWDKLIGLRYLSHNSISIEDRYEEFKGKYPYFREHSYRPLEFNCYAETKDFKETTVQEILGYNPFIKEATTAKDWNKVTEEELLEEAKRRYPIGCKVKLIKHNTGGDFKNEVRFTTYKTSDYSKGKQLFIDGNLLLFHEGIWAEIESLPEIKTKEVIPEYIECLKAQSDYFIPGNIYKVLDADCIVSCSITSNIHCGHYEANTLLWVSLEDTSYFKPSTKEKFDAQVEKEPVRLSFYVKYCDEFTEDLLKSLMEWSQKNNTLKNRGRDNSFKGLKDDGYFLFDNFGLTAPKNCLYKDRYGFGYGVDNNRQECFEEYSVKQVKELIGCKELTKSVEKWNVGSYIVPLQNKLLTRSEFLIKGKPYQIIKYTSLPYIISERGEEINFFDDDNTEKNEGIKWFATKSEAEEFAKTLVKQPLNMNKKKYTIKELETNNKLIIYLNSKEEHDKIQKVSKRICAYYGKHCYSLYEKSYSSSSSKSYPGAYSNEPIILTIDDIIFEDNIESSDKEISDESYIGRYVSFNYRGYFYDKAFIIKEKGYIYLLNNCRSNNDGHINKSIYKYSLRFDSIEAMLPLCKDIKFLDFKDNKFKPLTADDLIWGIDGASNLVWGVDEATDKIKLTYLPEPD